MSHGETKSATPWSQPESSLWWPSSGEKSQEVVQRMPGESPPPAPVSSLPPLVCFPSLCSLMPAAGSVPVPASCGFGSLSQKDSDTANSQKPKQNWCSQYGAVFLSSWHKSERGWGGRAGKRKREREGLTQGSGLFIFLPAATCYPHRGSPKTSYGLGWRGTSNLSCRLGPSQWITTLSRTYFFFKSMQVFYQIKYLHTKLYFWCQPGSLS